MEEVAWLIDTDPAEVAWAIALGSVRYANSPESPHGPILTLPRYVFRASRDGRLG
jgi:hypothetical protein